MSECVFCAELSEIKEINSSFMSEFPNHRHEYVISLVDRIYKNKSKKSRGITSYGGFSLNYCPVCGKKITEETK